MSKTSKKIMMTIEWKKNRTWGNCPRIYADVYYHNGSYDQIESYASGYGYDKESTVMADIFNCTLKYKLRRNEHRIKESPYGISFIKREKNNSYVLF